MARCALLLAFLHLSCFGALVKNVHGENVSIPATTQSVEEKWEEMEKSLKHLIGQGIEMILPTLTERMGRGNFSSSCVGDTMRLITGARSTKSWAMKILGANLGVLSGVAYETAVVLGAYDQCIDSEAINEHRNDEREILFRGKYCAVEIIPPLPPLRKSDSAQDPPLELKNFSTRNTIIGLLAKYSHGLYEFSPRFPVCVPSGCSENDVGHLMDAVSESISLPIRVKWCEVKEENKFTPLVIATLAIFAFLALVIVIGSLADQYFSSDSKCNGLLFNILLSFSIRKNFRILFSTSTSTAEISCLYGVRVLSICWIILGHSVFFYHLETTHESSFLLEGFQSLPYTIFYRGTLAVGTFFYLSGMLSCYMHIKLMKDLSRASDFFTYVFHRIYRLLPSLIFVTLFAFLFDLIGSGPLWSEYVKPDFRGCRDNWWPNFLFINNYYHVGETLCLGHTWYLACDTQLYIFSIAVIHLLIKRPKIGVTLSVGIILASMAATAAITIKNDLAPAPTSSIMSWTARMEFYWLLYIKPYPNAASYYVGVLAGYILICNAKIKISKIVQVLGWCTFTVFTGCVYFATWKWNLGAHPTFVETLFFSGFSRVTWALAMAWMILCCSTGHGGIINTMLSWKIWYPLGRLSFAAYLLHYLVLSAFHNTIRTQNSHYAVWLVWNFFGHALVTHGVAVILFLSVEAPFASLEKVFRSRGKAASPPVNANDKVNLETLDKRPDGEPAHFL